MKIKDLEIRNFRSIDDETGIQFEPNENLNIIVGENNAGKTNIFRALNYLKSLISKKTPFKDVDWHKGVTEKNIEIKVTFHLNQEEASRLLDQLIRNIDEFRNQEAKIERLRNELFENTQISLSYRKNVPLTEVLSVKCGFLYVTSNTGALKFDESKGYKYIEWGTLLSTYFDEENHKPLLELLQNEISEVQEPVVLFEVKLGELVQTLFIQHHKMFADIRRRPIGSTEYIFESFDGEKLATVLYNLKNGTKNEVIKWNSIKDAFSRFYPNFDLDTAMDRDKNVPFICIDAGFPDLIPLDALGAGTFEFLVFLTNMIGSEGKILVIEEPELHFHPHMQRRLFELFQKFKTNNQLFIITHSPYFIDPHDVDNNILVKEVSGSTKIVTPQGCFDKQEKEKLYRYLKRADYRELFFSRAVLLVEGKTEIGAMPVFAEKLAKSFDSAGISVIDTDGKHGFKTFMKLLSGFEIPFVIMCDKDAIMNIEGSIRYHSEEIQTSILFKQLYDLDSLSMSEITSLKQYESHIQDNIYDDQIFDELKSIARNHNCFPLDGDFEGVLKQDFGALLEDATKKMGRRSKVLCGIYVAEQMDAEEIPESFVEIIDEIWTLAS